MKLYVLYDENNKQFKTALRPSQSYKEAIIFSKLEAEKLQNSTYKAIPLEEAKKISIVKESIKKRKKLMKHYNFPYRKRQNKAKDDEILQ